LTQYSDPFNAEEYLAAKEAFVVITTLNTHSQELVSHLREWLVFFELYLGCEILILNGLLIIPVEYPLMRIP